MMPIYVSSIQSDKTLKKKEKCPWLLDVKDVKIS
jgi:hypothetical protein